MSRKRVLVLSPDVVGRRMAGPALRMYEISQILGQQCDVILMAAHTDGTEAEAFRVVDYSPKELRWLGRWADAVVLDPGVYWVFSGVRRLDGPVAIDLIWPRLLESLELARNANEADLLQQTLGRQVQLSDWLDPLDRGDFFFCGSPRQRDFYLGMLTAMGRLNPLTYYNDLELRRLIDVIPFGLPRESPQHTRDVLRGVVPGIAADDFILIWAGGVWSWLDPWTLLESMTLLRESFPRAKLYFMGTSRPQSGKGSSALHDRLVARARELGVLNRNVFINAEWIDYDARANYLLESDVGVTTHAAHLETHFAMRTRSLDYLWAGLPIVTSNGDWIAELVEQKGLGLAVAPRNPGALADAVRRIAGDETLRQAMRHRVADQARRWTWEQVCQPLLDFVLEPRFSADRAFRRRYSRKPRWWTDVAYKAKVLRHNGIAGLLRACTSLLPVRRVRVAFRDQGLRAGIQAVWREVRYGGPLP